MYSISGERVWDKEIQANISGGTTGSNSIEWNGKNRWGEHLANGVYIAYLEFKGSGKTIRKKLKIAVLK